MNICFFTYNYTHDDATALSNIFAFGVKKRVLADEVQIVDATDSRVNVVDHIKNTDLVVVAGTWGSNHASRNTNSDPISHMNSVNQQIRFLAKLMNKPLLVFESPTLSRVRSTVQTLKEKHPRYYRVSLGHWLYGLGEFFEKDHDHTRFEMFCKLNQLLKSKTEPLWSTRSLNAPVLVLPEKNSAPNPHGITPTQWTDITVNTLLKSTQRPIWIKPSPHHFENTDYTPYQNNRVTVLNKDISLKDLLKEAWATVVLDSTACFESLWQGVPVFCYPGSFASELGNTDITKIDIPVRAPLIPWWQRMAYTEFTQQEIQQGEMWAYIRPRILDKIARMKK